MTDNYDPLRLENQLCFPLYASAKKVVHAYTPFLDEIDLTYTQYLVMMVLWEKGKMSVKDLGNILFLDTGTLTPLLKRIEKKGIINRERDVLDERSVILSVTAKGVDLREHALSIPAKVGQCINISTNEAQTLYNILYKILKEGQ